MKFFLLFLIPCFAFGAQAFTVTATSEDVVVPTTTGPIVFISNPPSSLPVYSKGALTTFAITNARMGIVSLSSEASLNFVGKSDTIQVFGDGADRVIAQLNNPSNSFNIRVYDSTKPIGMWGYIADTNGEILLESRYTNVQTVPNGINTLRLNNATLEFRLSWSMPIPIAGIESAYVKHVGSNGEEWAEELWVSNGKIHFPVNYASTTGNLVISVRNSQGILTQVAYSLSTGDQITPTTVTGGIASVIQNNVIATDVGLAVSSPLLVSNVVTPPSVNNYEVVTPPTAILTISAPLGVTRVCKVSVVVNRTLESLGTITAFANAMPENGALLDDSVRQGVITTTSSGGYTTITSTWYLYSGGMPQGTRWFCGFEIGAYEAQSPPTTPYNGGGKG
jgi:hypothetical protein